MRTPFTGVGTALITPFTQGRRSRRGGGPAAGQATDRCRHSLPVAMRHHWRSPTLTHREKLRVVELVVEEAAGRVPGAGGRRRVRHPRGDRARARPRAGWRRTDCLSVTPYYNKPTQEGLYQHFKAIAERRRCRSCSTTCPGEPASTSRSQTVVRLVGDPQHRSGQGSVGERRPDVRHHREHARRLHAAQRRRSADRGGDGDRRARHHLRDVEPGARGVRADRRAVRARRLRRRPQAVQLAAAAHSGELRRGQPDSLQGGDGGHGAASRRATGCRSCRPATATKERIARVLQELKLQGAAARV